jgi:predicted lipoprotein with Yx(FWY)xxD motif
MSNFYKPLKAFLVAAALLVLLPAHASALSGPGAETALIAAPATPAANSGFDVQVRYVAGLGNILVGDDGMTLYVFLKDSPGVSMCTGACATLWPGEALNLGDIPVAGPGVTAKVDALVVSDETALLTINGLPVYNYSLDKTPGDVLGQGFKGVWYVLDPSGALIKLTPGSMAPGAETPTP